MKLVPDGGECIIFFMYTSKSIYKITNSVRIPKIKTHHSHCLKYEYALQERGLLFHWLYRCLCRSSYSFSNNSSNDFWNFTTEPAATSDDWQAYMYLRLVDFKKFYKRRESANSINPIHALSIDLFQKHPVCGDIFRT